MKLSKNLLLEWTDETVNRIERVLWINVAANDVVTIELNSAKALPVWQKCSEMETAIAAHALTILEDDPYAPLLRPDADIDESHRRRRDQAWAVIAPILEHGEKVFIRSERGQFVTDAAQRSGRTLPTIYRYLRLYWQGGQVKNALLPRFDRCGGADKLRQPNQAKRGRPTKRTQLNHQPVGVNVDDQVREYFRRGIQLFYETQQQRTLKEAFQLTLEKFFHRGYEQRQGVMVPVLPPTEELPTYEQFCYWHRKERNLSRTLISRSGQRQFNLRHRPVLGNSTLKATGPGALYQIDATIGDIYLVSSLDRNRIIGRPVIYLIVDVFSRLIVGFSVSLEGPSWLGAMLALENAAADKVPFCQEYGVEITESQWPAHHLPEAILADRGELLSANANQMVNALGIRIDHTPPFRPDWKPIVERYFRLSNDKLIHWMPGAVSNPRRRGERDYRLDAVLDLNQLRQLIILSILDHNLHHRLNTYPANEFMIADQVEPYAIDLWRWGVQNHGCPRRLAPEIVRLNLLPSAHASVTHQGIYCRGLFYTCDLAVQEQWFVKARLQGRWKLPIAYDPRKLDTLYLRLEGGKRMEVCRLLPRSLAFQGRDWHEADDYLALKQQRDLAAQTRAASSQALFHAQVDQIVAQAIEQTQQAQTDQPKASRLRDIRKNRRRERLHEQQIGAEQFSPQPIPAAPSTPPPEESSVEAPDEYLPPPQSCDQFRKLREESWSDDA